MAKVLAQQLRVLCGGKVVWFPCNGRSEEGSKGLVNKQLSCGRKGGDSIALSTNYASKWIMHSF